MKKINNLTDIHNTKELALLATTYQREEEGFNIARPLLKQKNVTIDWINPNRFAIYDAIATSGHTDGTEEQIILEFKYRWQYTNDHFESVTLDSKKCRELLNLHKANNIRVFVVYIFNDKKVRLFEFSKYYRNYDGVKVREIQYSTYRPQEKKEQTLILYNNKLTTLLE